MVRVKLVSRELNSERTEYIDVVRAELLVNGPDDVQVLGDRSWVDLDVPVFDPETGKSLRFEDDADAWARGLASAYRSGDIVAVVDAGVPADAVRHVQLA